MPFQITQLDIKENIPLKTLTTVGIGGPAKKLVAVKNTEELIEAIKYAVSENLPYLIIGGGSNLLVADEGFDGLIIKNEITGIQIADNLISAKSGTPLQSLVNFSIKEGLAGMQNLTGIPGTLGGAIYGNAGAYGQTISDHLTEVLALDPKTFTMTGLSNLDCCFSYRNSYFKKSPLLILEVKIILAKTDPKLLSQQAAEILFQRREKYPPSIKCPGSFFKNVFVENISPESLKLIPQDKIKFGKIPAGYLLEAVGAKGAKQGNIEISSYHGNLFKNLGDGTAADFYKLAAEYAQKVKNKFAITLEPEVQLINLPKII